MRRGVHPALSALEATINKAADLSDCISRVASDQLGRNYKSAPHFTT